MVNFCISTVVVSTKLPINGYKNRIKYMYFKKSQKVKKKEYNISSSMLLSDANKTKETRVKQVSSYHSKAC